MNIEIANRLLQYRKASGLSQEELAEKIGVSRQAVSKWERAEASPDTDNLIILADVYGVTLDKLLKGETEKESENESVNESVKESEKESVKEPERETSEKPEPDKNTTYTREDKVSFKNGIHVDSDGDKVDISFRDGINVHAKDGSFVKVGGEGIHVYDGKKTRAYTDENGHVHVDEELRHHKAKKIAHVFPFWAIALAGMLIWGFSGVLCGWALSWICMLFIPIYHTTVEAISKRKLSAFCYPVLCVIFQMVTGFLFDGWTWGWIIYITIPIFYAITSVLEKSDNREDED